jgi:tetratricopeptide (TPR) repeat protein
VNSRTLAILARPLLLSILAGCSTATLNLQSTPSNAQVFAKPVSGGEFRQIGETPLTISGAEIQRSVGSIGPLYLEFRKDGHLSERTLLAELPPAEISISLDLRAISGLEDHERVNSVMDQLFEAQRLARAGRLDAAMARLRELEREAPYLSAIYELQGGILYMQKKYSDALDAYGTAVKLNPKNTETIRMRNMIAGMLNSGDREPAGGGKR